MAPYTYCGRIACPLGFGKTKRLYWNLPAAVRILAAWTCATVFNTRHAGPEPRVPGRYPRGSTLSLSESMVATMMTLYGGAFRDEEIAVNVRLLDGIVGEITCIECDGTGAFGPTCG